LALGEESSKLTPVGTIWVVMGAIANWRTAAHPWERRLNDDGSEALFEAFPWLHAVGGTAALGI
jgi:hypothetical protein